VGRCGSLWVVVGRCGSLWGVVGLLVTPVEIESNETGK
jgi:hypothetical protein